MQPLPLSALFLDFDSYFASVEQHLSPHLRGKAVAVTPVLTDSSCCIAASYEAKAYGVKTGTSVRDARQLCPAITIVPARPEEYIRFHHLLVAAVEDCIHVEATLSIDELWCWLPYNLRSIEQISRIAHHIKQNIADTVSPAISCSIGVSTNRWLAKMASKMRKPNGFLILQHSELPHALHPLKLSDLTGIGHSMELRLHARGIHSVADLCAASRETLHSIWGSIEGDRFWLQLHGHTLPELPPAPPKSIGHSHVLPPQKRTPDRALPVLHRLTQKAATRLRSHDLLAASLSISLDFLHSPPWSAEIRFEPSIDSIHLAHATHSLWDKRPNKTAKLIKVAITLGHLIEPDNHTPSLFSQTQQARSQLSHALDAIRAKHGQHSIHLGCDHDAQEDAPTRISFTHIPEM